MPPPRSVNVQLGPKEERLLITGLHTARARGWGGRGGSGGGAAGGRGAALVVGVAVPSTHTPHTLSHPGGGHFVHRLLLRAGLEVCAGV